MAEEFYEIKTVCGMTHYRRRCAECGEKIWSQFRDGYVACSGCIIPGPIDFGHDTGGGRRVNHKGTEES